MLASLQTKVFRVYVPFVPPDSFYEEKVGPWLCTLSSLPQSSEALAEHQVCAFLQRIHLACPYLSSIPLFLIFVLINEVSFLGVPLKRLTAVASFFVLAKPASVSHSAPMPRWRRRAGFP